MQAETGARLVEQLRRELAVPVPHPPFEIPAERYRSPAWLARERAALFEPSPRIATLSSALAPMSCAPHDRATDSLLLTRGADGIARGVANACRHRATRLVDAPCAAKAIVCPYHGWTYDLAGALIHVPHDEAFAGIPLATRRLRARTVRERHGLVWIGGDGDESALDAYLGDLGPELAALGFADHVPFRATRVTRACNWKLVVEAFLDGYHIRILHRDSIYRFFIDAASVAEPVGPHVRAITGRRTLRDATAAAPADLRAIATPSFLVFPATVIIVHPDFISLITLDPVAPDRTDYHHVMVVPAARASETEHWERSWALIEEQVFQREDLWVCEQAQRGLASGDTETLLFGSLENPVRWFHAAIDEALGSRATASTV